MRDHLLVQPEALASELDDPNLRVFDATVYLKPAENGYRAESGRARYAEGHIPGAAFLDLIEDFADTTSGYGFTLPGVEALAAAAGQAGIGPEHRVVCYAAGHMMWATRAFWLLRALGHEDVRVLDGGYDGWRAAGLAEATGEQSYEPQAAYPAQWDGRWFADMAEVDAASRSGVCTVNALSADLYTGEGDFHYGRRGHIPGSTHLFYGDLMDEGRFKAADDLQTVFAARGLLDPDRVITYCGGGIAATLDGFALLLCGRDNVGVYDGSMSEWVANDMPLKEGAEP